MAGLLVGLSNASAAKKPEPVPLTAAGEKLLAHYTEMLDGLRAEIAKALPAMDEQRQAAFLKAYQEEATARAAELKGLRGQDRKPAGHPSKKVYEDAKEALALFKKCGYTVFGTAPENVEMEKKRCGGACE